MTTMVRTCMAVRDRTEIMANALSVQQGDTTIITLASSIFCALTDLQIFSPSSSVTERYHNAKITSSTSTAAATKQIPKSYPKTAYFLWLRPYISESSTLTSEYR